jgi:hypothetical protein
MAILEGGLLKSPGVGIIDYDQIRSSHRYRLLNGVTLLAKFDGEFAGHAQTYAGTGTIRWTW